jgi:hypothetical protein
MRCLILLMSLAVAANTAPRLRVLPLTDPAQVEVIVALPENLQAQLPAGKLTQDQGETWLRFALLDDAGTDGPPILGTYEHRQAELIFRPRYPLLHDHVYRAHFEPAKGQSVVTNYRVPARPKTPPAVVTKVYPSGAVLPANHLKFYIYFSKPMRGGPEIFDQIQILDADGKAVYDPWLHDELWDEDDCRLLIYIQPGRIKWGLLLRETLGPVLLPNREYILVIRGTMLDANVQPLGKEFRKKFRTTAEDRQRVELAAWKLQAPAAGSRQPVVLDFPKALDPMSLRRFLTVTDTAGQPVAGKVTVGSEERSWSFHPARPWTGAAYTITVDGKLEDVAGNNPLRPFDLDLQAPLLPPQKLTIPFRPATSPATSQIIPRRDALLLAYLAAVEVHPCRELLLGIANDGHLAALKPR